MCVCVFFFFGEYFVENPPPFFLFLFLFIFPKHLSKPTIATDIIFYQSHSSLALGAYIGIKA